MAIDWSAEHARAWKEEDEAAWFGRSQVLGEHVKDKVLVERARRVAVAAYWVAERVTDDSQGARVMRAREFLRCVTPLELIGYFADSRSLLAHDVAWWLDRLDERRLEEVLALTRGDHSIWARHLFCGLPSAG